MSYPVFYPPAGSVLYVPFATYALATGASITLTGLAVTDIEIYKAASMTQRASDAGYTLLDTDGIDLDGTTGIHGFSINLADNTTAGFYAEGSSYFVVVSAVTIDTQTVNFIAAWFQIRAAESVAGVPIVDPWYWRGDVILAPVIAGQPTVDANYFSGVAQTSGDLIASMAALAAPTAAANATELLDQADTIETGLTVRQTLRLSAAANAGKVSGAATALIRVRNALVDSKDRIIATVDASGNRSAITLDVS